MSEANEKPYEGVPQEEKSYPARRKIVTTQISVTSYAEVFAAITSRPVDTALGIACCNVHSVMTAFRDRPLKEALAAAQITTPDGIPLVWALRAIHDETIQQRVYGPDLMVYVLDRGRTFQLRHSFFGSTEPTLETIRQRTELELPGAVISGMEAPPFRPLNEEELAAAAARIREQRPDVLWLGLGMPKQELLMHRLMPLLPGVAIVGVGAAFDFFAGNIPQAPVWLQRRGGEWAFRLVQEPRRLYRRYLFNNPLYLGWLGYAWGKKKLKGLRPPSSRDAI